MNNNGQKNFLDNFRNPNGSYHIPVWLIVVGFCFNWMLGAGLMIARLCEDKPAAVGQTAAENQNPSAATATTATGSQKTKTKKKKSPAAILTGLGVFAVLLGVVDLPDSIQYLVWCINNDTGISYAVEDVAKNGIWIISGVIMLIWAQRLRSGERIRNKITAIVGDAPHMHISEVAEALPASRNKTEKYLQQCIDSGMFGEKAYLDMRSECIVISGPAPMSKKERAAQEAARKAEAEAEANLDEYEKILKEIREINDKIPGEEFSAKISRLEDLTAKIFKIVQNQPEKQKKLRKFISYYLPTSMKLLHNYQQMDAQGIEGKNISEAKQQIEETMDTMISAFERQLDALFSTENMDVSADIAAMQNLMKADGLIENELTDKIDKLQ